MENNQTVTEKDEAVAQLEKEKSGLLREVVEQRKTNRALEERISLIESSLNAPETEQAPVDVRVQKLASDPDLYIREIVEPLLEKSIKPLAQAFTNAQIDKKLDSAMEFIAEEEGITKRQAAKKYEKTLAEISESHGFGTLDPYDGTLAAYKIMKTDHQEKEQAEKERDKTIQGNHTETARSQTKERGKIWKTSEIAKLSRGPNGEFAKNADEILRQQREGLIIRDT